MVVTAMAVTVVNCMLVVTVMPVTVLAIGMAAQPMGVATAIGTVAIGTVAIGMGMATGIGGMVDGGPMVLDLVGEWSLAAGFGSVTDSACRNVKPRTGASFFAPPMRLWGKGRVSTTRGGNRVFQDPK
jgi:hypothetical protein